MEPQDSYADNDLDIERETNARNELNMINNSNFVNEETNQIVQNDTHESSNGPEN